jgi:hypothetical protein
MEAKLCNPIAADFSRTSVGFDEIFGRNFKISLAGIHNINHFATRMLKITLILFFTQLMGIVFGEQPGKLGFGSELVSARQAMTKINVETPEVAVEAAQAAKPRKATGSPMPPPLANRVCTRRVYYRICSSRENPFFHNW